MKKLLILMVAIMLPNMANAVSMDEELNFSCGESYATEFTCMGNTYDYVYGSTANTTNYTARCFRKWRATVMGAQVADTVQIITGVMCDSAQGYAAADAADVTLCIDTTTGETITLTPKRCACADVITWNANWVTFSLNTAYQRLTGTKVNCGTTSTVYKYRCNTGYYSSTGVAESTTQTDLTCVACPANAATCAAGSTTFKCNAGYYRFGTGCTSCVTTCGVGHTSVAGATSHAQCRAEASVTLDDGLGKFEYTTACCCNTTCDERCESGKSCLSNSDCESNLCGSDGCCVVQKDCGIFSPCSSNSDCPALQTCKNGCCGISVATTCSSFDDNYCASNSDCDRLQTCNTKTNCCESSGTVLPSLVCTITSPLFCTSSLECEKFGSGSECNLTSNCCETDDR